jgi:hypothetical protein
MNGKPQAALQDYPMVAIIVAMGGMVGYLALRNSVGRFHTVTVTDTGEIILRHLFGSTRLRASDVLCIEGQTASIDFEDRDAREIRVHHTGGVSVIPYFLGAPFLVTHLRALNPRIALDGYLYESRAPTPRIDSGETPALRYSKADVFERPDLNSKVVGTLVRGDEFAIVGEGPVRGQEGEFYQVRASSGLEGYVFGGNLTARTSSEPSSAPR